MTTTTTTMPNVSAVAAGLKRKSRTPVWTIEFDDASSLRSVVDAVAAVMNRVTFRVSKPTDMNAYMLMFDGNDHGMSCVVSARITIDHVFFASNTPPVEFTFCLECKQLLVSIDNPSCARGKLRIESYDDDASVRIVMQDPELCSHMEESNLNTYVDDVEEFGELDDMRLDYTMETDVSKFKEMIKKARKSHAERIRIQLFFPEEGSKLLSVIKFEVKGEGYACHSQTYINETQRGADGSIIVRAFADSAVNHTDFDVSDLICAVDAVFPVDKIEAFIRILPVRMIKVKLENSKPLVMTHELGGGVLGDTSGDGVTCNSFIRFLVAPLNDAD
tara:strand:+ start:5856 stop:6851 length:996 start_codon:yes stop_codon:yes gene_type:complete